MSLINVIITFFYAETVDTIKNVATAQTKDIRVVTQQNTKISQVGFNESTFSMSPQIVFSVTIKVSFVHKIIIQTMFKTKITTEKLQGMNCSFLNTVTDLLKIDFHAKC